MSQTEREFQLRLHAPAGDARADARCAEVQSQLDPVYQLHNLRAPQRVHGESEQQYSIRLLKPLQQFSETWAKADLAQMDRAGLFPVVVNDVLAAARKAATKNEGPLRMVKVTDDSGRKITRFYGAPGSAWNRFKLPYRFIKSINGESLF
jgi:hypothetical protein